VKLLLLGGPKFLGRAVADAALARGHELTFFNRRRTNPDLHPEVEKLRGDRAGDLTALHGRVWDAVVDTSCYLPGNVTASTEALAESGVYCFVSTISVYADFSVAVDVRDLGGWIVDLCERGAGGVFNATHPGYEWAEPVETCRSVIGSDARSHGSPTTSSSSKASASGWSGRSGSPIRPWLRPTTST
jgi:hypothetical protein